MYIVRLIIYENKKDAIVVVADWKKLGQFVRRVSLGDELTTDETFCALDIILHNDSLEADFYWGALFSSLQTRGVTFAEITGFVNAVGHYDSDVILKNNEKKKISNKPVYAITGSGKDTWKTFNISTASAFVAASCGVAIIKPGSSALTSHSGALQILNDLDILQAKTDDEVSTFLGETNLAIVSFADCVSKYANRYDGRFYHFHPLSYIMPIVAIPYNLTGVSYGIADKNIEMSASLIKEHGIKDVIVSTSFHNDFGFTDELIPFGQGSFTFVSDTKTIRNAFTNDLCRDPMSIKGADTHYANAQKVIESISQGRTNCLSRCVAMMSGTILLAAGKADSIEQGYNIAMSAIENGEAYKTYLKYKQISQRIKNDN